MAMFTKPLRLYQSVSGKQALFTHYNPNNRIIAVITIFGNYGI